MTQAVSTNVRNMTAVKSSTLKLFEERDEKSQALLEKYAETRSAHRSLAQAIAGVKMFMDQQLDEVQRNMVRPPGGCCALKSIAAPSLVIF